MWAGRGVQADSLPSEPPGKPNNNRVDSLSLLQGIFPTQESNQGLLHAGRFFTNWATREALFKAVNGSKSFAWLNFLDYFPNMDNKIDLKTTY